MEEEVRGEEEREPECEITARVSTHSGLMYLSHKQSNITDYFK